MTTSYSPKGLRVDLIAGPLLLIAFNLTWHIRPRNLLTFFGLFALAAGVFCIARAYYLGTTLLYNHLQVRFRRPLELTVVALTCLIALYQFLPGASLRRLEVGRESGLWAAGVALALGWFARSLTATFRPIPRMRAYLAVLACLTLLLGPKRYGYSFGSSDETVSAPETEPDTPEQNKDWALFHFLLYSATCFVGVASVKGPATAT